MIFLIGNHMGRKKKSTRKLLTLIFLICIIAIFAFLVFSGKNIAGMIRALGSADYCLVLLAFGIYIFGTLCWSARWCYTLSCVGYRIPLRHIFQVVLSGIFINNITPMTYAGGDPIARTVLMSRTSRLPTSHISATIASEVLLDIPLFCFLLLFGIFASFLKAPMEVLILLLAGWILVVFLFVLGVSAFLKRNILAKKFVRIYIRILRFLHRSPNKRKISATVKNFYAGAGLVLGKMRAVLTVTLMSSFLWALGIIRMWTVFSALGYSPQLPMLILALTLPAIAGLLPLLPGGLGTVDITILSVFLMYDVPKELATSALLIDRSISLLFGTAIGAIAMSRMGLKVWRGERIVS